MIGKKEIKCTTRELNPDLTLDKRHLPLEISSAIWLNHQIFEF